MTWEMPCGDWASVFIIFVCAVRAAHET